MERLLQGKEMDKMMKNDGRNSDNIINNINSLFNEAFNLNSSLVFFPVRHHSPACSYHLKNIINSYMPDKILIEGPFESNHLIKYLQDENSKAPICIYYSYADKENLLEHKDEEEKTKNDGKYMCYYPFLDYSPELVAIRAAKSLDIKAEFIDLSYPHILLNSQSGEGLREESKKTSYNDEYLIARSKYIKNLCEKEGCRNFSEVWEKLYEIDGMSLDSEEFVKNMLAFCYLSRVGYTEEMLSEDGCTAREIYMADKIKGEMNSNQKVLVVTGGFHTWGLIEILRNSNKCLGESNIKKRIKLNDIDPSHKGDYVIPYSLESSDQLGGYESGMPYPAFYQKVWENICHYQGPDGVSLGHTGSKSLGCLIDRTLDKPLNKPLKKPLYKPFDKAVLHFIIDCAKKVREADGTASTADEIEAFNMANGLKDLRDKYECGVYELRDGIQSSFVKGELSVSNNTPIEKLDKILKGNSVGVVCEGADVPPIVKDFREICIKYKLKINSTSEQEIILDVYKNDKHRQLRNLFSIMNFLYIGFCKKVKGPDFARRKNMNLVREIWTYRWSTEVEVELIEKSVYGGSLKEAAIEFLKLRLKDVKNSSSQVSILMIEAFMMGIEEDINEIQLKLKEIIQNDGVFYSVSNCLYNLNFLYSLKKQLHDNKLDELTELIKQAYLRVIALILNIGKVPSEDEDITISSLKDIFYLVIQEEPKMDKEIFGDILVELINQKEINPAVEGAAIGILLGIGILDKKTAVKRAEGYLFGVGEKLLESAHFLKGIFATARDIVYYDSSISSAESLDSAESIKNDEPLDGVESNNDVESDNDVGSNNDVESDNDVGSNNSAELINNGGSLVSGLDYIIKNLEEENFLKIIPELRLAFSYFSPKEIDEIGGIVAQIYGISKKKLKEVGPVDPEELELGLEMDRTGMEFLGEWRLSV